jgi:hypothetical protein
VTAGTGRELRPVGASIVRPAAVTQVAEPGPSTDVSRVERGRGHARASELDRTEPSARSPAGRCVGGENSCRMVTDQPEPGPRDEVRLPQAQRRLASLAEVTAALVRVTARALAESRCRRVRTTTWGPWRPHSAATPDGPSVDVSFCKFEIAGVCARDGVDSFRAIAVGLMRRCREVPGGGTRSRLLHEPGLAPPAGRAAQSLCTSISWGPATSRRRRRSRTASSA